VGLAFYKAVTVADRTYLINSGSSVRIFNHTTNMWEIGTGGAAPFDDPSFDIDIWVGPDNRIFILVVSSNLSPERIDVFFYEVHPNTNSGTWFQNPSLTTTDHRYFAMRVIDEFAFVAGGFRQFVSTKTFNGTYRHDIFDGVWATNGFGTLQVRRHRARAVTLDGAMYLLGGSGGDGGPELRDMESYSVAGNVWTTRPKMLRARIEHAAVVLDGKIYVIGGSSDSSAATALASMDVFTP
jgi:hypothetical protein